MRTRTSNRTKRYTVEKYDFELSSDEEPPPRRRKAADDKDDNFDAAAEPSAAEDEEDDLVQDVASHASASEPEAPIKIPRPRVKPAKAFNAPAAENVGYLDVELMPPDGLHKGYIGPYDRGQRGKALIRTWYGPKQEGIEMAHEMVERWIGWPFLPPKLAEDEEETVHKNFWAPDVSEKEAQFAESWHARLKKDVPRRTIWSQLTPDETHPYRFPQKSMPVIMGPSLTEQDVRFEPGLCHPLSHAGVPFDQDENEEKIPTGWMLDVGGLVLGMDWAPRREKNIAQLLALAIIPHTDQEFYNYEEESVKPDFQKYGVIQLWEFPGTRSDPEFFRPSTEKATLRQTICLEYGRARRVRWSPYFNHMAVLCGDGRVCVIEVQLDEENDEGGRFYKVQEPLVSFSLSDEDGIKASALTWVNCNRLAIGYTDGSIGLWSIYPRRLLLRHPVHHNEVVNMVSGYPILPNLIASSPIGGTLKLIDLGAPSYEITEVQRPMINTQPGLIGFSNHLLGFLSIYPSASSLNTIVGFLHHAHFPIVRRVITGDSYLTCLAVGRTHPYLLVGALDGSLWALNPQAELFSNRQESTDKIRILQHEHRPALFFPPDSPASQRGACRILQGFSPERNRNSKPESKPGTKKGKKPAKKKKDAPVDGGEDDDEAGDMADPSRGVLHEPQTRITVIEWNPNEDYGCWAAVAIGSGLVRIIDLGLE